MLKRAAGSEKRQQARQWKREDTSIQRTVADARAAGIHPLFALGGATGGSSFAPAPTGTRVGNALKYIRKQTTQASGSRQSSLVDQALIRSSDASARASNARANMTEWQLSENKRGEVNSNSQQDTIALSKYLAPGFERKKVLAYNPITHGKVPGGTIKFRDRMSAQMWEDQYGDIAQEVGGLWNLTTDLGRMSVDAIANFLARKYHTAKPKIKKLKSAIRKYKKQTQWSMDPTINWKK